MRLQGGRERCRRRQAEQDVPVDVLCEEDVGRGVRGQDDPANDASDGQRLGPAGVDGIKEFGDVRQWSEREEVERADWHCR